MTQKEVIRKIVDLLSLELNGFDFKTAIKEQGFIRRDKSSIYFYYFLIYNRTNIKSGVKGFQIEPYADINIPEIERYYKDITINTELKADWDFITLGNSIANLLANPDGINRKRNQSLDLFVFEENHIKSVADELLKQFNNVALPYFLANNTVKTVDILLNKHPKEYCVHLNNDLFRFIKGIIAAKLNNNPQFEQLQKIYSDLLIKRDMPNNCIEEMIRLKRILPMIGDSLTV